MVAWPRMYQNRRKLMPGTSAVPVLVFLRQSLCLLAGQSLMRQRSVSAYERQTSALSAGTKEVSELASASSAATKDAEAGNLMRLTVSSYGDVADEKGSLRPKQLPAVLMRGDMRSRSVLRASKNNSLGNAANSTTVRMASAVAKDENNSIGNAANRTTVRMASAVAKDASLMRHVADVVTKRKSDSDDCEYNIARYRKAARWLRHLAGLDPKPSRELSTGAIIEPTGSPTATILLLHGLGDTSSYWRPFYDALQRRGFDLSGVRWVGLDAPVRKVWGTTMPSWFEYYTCRCGQAVEDEISALDLERTRGQLHGIIHAEAAKLDAGTQGVFLVGSSQGASVALDAALTYQHWEEKNADPGDSTLGLGLAGVAMLRGLPLGITADAVAAHGSSHRQLLPLLAVSGGRDRTFAPGLVASQLRRVSHAVKLTHRLVPQLTHQVSYNPAEIAYFVSWFGRRFGMNQSRPVRIKMDVLPVMPAEEASDGYTDYDYDGASGAAISAPNGK